MAQLLVGKLMDAMQDANLNQDQKEKVEKALKDNLPAGTYNAAVKFLGWSTLLLVVGGIVLAALGKAVPEGLWTVLGAGIGGLAGIFVGNR